MALSHPSPAAPRGIAPALCFALGVLGVAATVVLSLLYVPPMARMSLTQRIFYPKIAFTFVGYFWFLLCFLTSALYLKTRKPLFDRHATSAAALGLGCCTVPLVCGPLWAKMEWNLYWDWGDARLVTTLMLWAVYAGYFALRSAVEHPEQRARFCAVMGVIGFAMVPIVHFAVRIWHPEGPLQHPTLGGESGGSFFSEPTVQLTVFAIGLPAALLFTLGCHGWAVESGALRRKVQEARESLRAPA